MDEPHDLDRPMALADVNSHWGHSRRIPPGDCRTESRHLGGRAASPAGFLAAIGSRDLCRGACAIDPPPSCAREQEGVTDPPSRTCAIDDGCLLDRSAHRPVLPASDLQVGVVVARTRRLTRPGLDLTLLANQLNEGEEAVLKVGEPSLSPCTHAATAASSWRTASVHWRCRRAPRRESLGARWCRIGACLLVCCRRCRLAGPLRCPVPSPVTALCRKTLNVHSHVLRGARRRPCGRRGGGHPEGRPLRAGDCTGLQNVFPGREGNGKTL